MNHVRAGLCLIAAIYVALLVLFQEAVNTGGDGFIFGVWKAAGSAMLLGTALDLSLGVLWAAKQAGLLKLHDSVPVQLDRAGLRRLRRLGRRGRRVAVLMPARNECTTSDDRGALTARLVDWMQKLPRFARLYVLFDSGYAQQANERGVIRAVREELRAAGLSGAARRLRAMELYDKPEGYKTKLGSVALWVLQFADRYRYLYVIDADTSLPDPDLDRPETGAVVERLILALEQARDQGRPIAMLQSAIGVRPTRAGEPRSLWCRWQEAGARLGLNYHAPLWLLWLLAGSSPSYGHAVAFDISLFVEHVLNPRVAETFLSHDHIEAAELIAAGCRCEFSLRVLHYDEPEPMLQFCVRMYRWHKGDAQWPIWIVKKAALCWKLRQRLPLSAVFFLTLGWLSDLFPLAGTVFMICSCLLLQEGVPLTNDARPDITAALLAAMLFGLLFPKLVL